MTRANINSETTACENLFFTTQNLCLVEAIIRNNLISWPLLEKAPGQFIRQQTHARSALTFKRRRRGKTIVTDAVEPSKVVLPDGTRTWSSSDWSECLSLTMINEANEPGRCRSLFCTVDAPP